MAGTRQILWRLGLWLGETSANLAWTARTVGVTDECFCYDTTLVREQTRWHCSQRDSPHDHILPKIS